MRVEHIYTPVENCSSRSRLVALLLCFFLGIIGAHKFYLGRFGLGLVYLFTYGLFGIGWLVDMIVLLAGHPRDKQGLPLTWH
ncbi:MAG: TM2 domain-containing protein [Clostridia bacterium]|nr:TM2 domain-containing protein [Clostridia bacterium]